MPNADTAASTTTIEVFTRHSADCKSRKDIYCRTCNCRKSIYIYENGKKRIESAKTRTWKHAEELAQQMRDARDPAQIKLKAIEAKQAAAEAAQQAKLIPVEVATQQWLAGHKNPKPASLAAYRSTMHNLVRWAESKGIAHVSEITFAALNAWRSDWSPEAKAAENRLALTTQAARLVRLRSFFLWATEMEYVTKNPAALLRSVPVGDSETMPLTPEQFDQVIDATYLLDTDARYNAQKVGAYLRAISWVQRETGLRIGDASMLKRSQVNGLRIRLTMQKTGEDLQVVITDELLAALEALPQPKHVHPDYFFWSGKSKPHTNTNKWVRKIERVNGYVALAHPVTGEPMGFRSHMLRDTFAVEMLQAGMLLEDVSKLLGHKSIQITQRYYAKWVPSRLQQLEDKVIAAHRKLGRKVSKVVPIRRSA